MEKFGDCVDCSLLRTDKGQHRCAIDNKPIHDVCEMGCSNFEHKFYMKCGECGETMYFAKKGECMCLECHNTILT